MLLYSHTGQGIFPWCWESPQRSRWFSVPAKVWCCFWGLHVMKQQKELKAAQLVVTSGFVNNPGERARRFQVKRRNQFLKVGLSSGP